MRISGLQVDAQKIAAGIYDMIVDRGEQHLVRFGMLPAPMMELLEKQLREKVISVAAERHGVTKQELELMGIEFDEKKIQEITRPIIREITLGIYAECQKKDGMIV